MAFAQGSSKRTLPVHSTTETQIALMSAVASATASGPSYSTSGEASSRYAAFGSYSTSGGASSRYAAFGSYSTSGGASSRYAAFTPLVE
ncbi:hypothetical protein [Agrococcus sp. DT81.2]|uniref:hypothetical protein n=1 Tax=Agrococcus sp. DT81.2 TaxID=3393414 RepID=UPI003CE48C3C